MKYNYITKEEWDEIRKKRIDFLIKAYAFRRTKHSKLIRFIFNRKNNHV